MEDVYVVMLGRHPMTDKGKENFDLLKTHTSNAFYYSPQLVHKEQRLGVYSKSEEELATWRWRNNDIRMLDFWEIYGEEIKKDSPNIFIYFIDDDVRFDCKPEHVDPAIDSGEFSCHQFRDLITIKETNWSFRGDIKKLPEKLQEHAAAITPIAVLGLTSDMLDDLMFYYKNSDIFQQDIFGELRIGTLLNYLGYERHNNDSLKYVRNFPFPPRPGHVCHPVK